MAFIGQKWLEIPKKHDFQIFIFGENFKIPTRNDQAPFQIQTQILKNMIFKISIFGEKFTKSPTFSMQRGLTSRSAGFNGVKI